MLKILQRHRSGRKSAGAGYPVQGGQSYVRSLLIGLCCERGMGFWDDGRLGAAVRVVRPRSELSFRPLILPLPHTGSHSSLSSAASQSPFLPLVSWSSPWPHRARRP